MEQYFTKGSRIPLQNGQSAEVIAKLGDGGQGTVYRVRVTGQEYALKWYHKGALQNPRRFYQNLENNIRQLRIKSATKRYIPMISRQVCFCVKHPQLSNPSHPYPPSHFPNALLHEIWTINNHFHIHCNFTLH